MSALFEGEAYTTAIEGCSRIFRFQPGAVASQTGSLLLTPFRLRFVPRPCRCTTLGQLGPPNWHDGDCDTKGPVSPYGSYLSTWPPTADEIAVLLSDALIKNTHAVAEDVRFAYDIPLFAIKRIQYEKRALSMACRDGRSVVFELCDHNEADEFLSTLTAFAFPDDSVTGSYAFQTRYRVGLGWDLFDYTLDGARTLESRSRVHLRRVTSPCSTYPSTVWVPSSISDDEVAGSAAFRSMGRFPVPVWAHPKNGALLVRSAQPLVGLLGNRSTSDEKLIRILCGDSYLLLDARSRAAAFGNRAMGKGTESIERGYEGAAELVFCDLGNIHHLRHCEASLMRSIENCSVDALALAQDTSSWLMNVSQLLRASLRIVTAIDQMGLSTWTHCSDGWDRTAQMCALAQVLMEPEYRTRVGLAVVVEKNFAYFGFKFRDRSRTRPRYTNSPPGLQSFPFDPLKPILTVDNEGSETAPVFLLFIECMFQLLKQFPDRFDYNTHFLLAVIDAYYSGRFGTFLCNSDRERTERRVQLETRAVWDSVCLDERFSNPRYNNYLGTLYPDCSDAAMELFSDYWKRFDARRRQCSALFCYY